MGGIPAPPVSTSTDGARLSDMPHTPTMTTRATRSASGASGRTVRSLVAALLVALASFTGIGLLAAPAQAACTCTEKTSFAKQLAGAQTVLVGTVERQTVGVGDEATLEVLASRVYKGTVTDARMTVKAKGGSCAYWSGASDQRLLLVVTDGRADACGGSRVASADVLERVQSRLGVGQRVAPPAPEHAVRTKVETDEPREFARLAAPGAAAALLGLLGLAVVRRVQHH